jgi:ESF2/ABP1 family protein
MTTRKRNEWLDADDSEDEDQFSDTERLERSRGATIAGTNAKRRKLDGDDYIASEDNSAAEYDDLEEEQEEIASQNGPQVESANSRRPTSESKSSPADSDKKAKSSLAKKLAKASEKAHKSGVVYISRIPPFMKPHTVKHFLSPYAPSGLGRVFLTPETPEARSSRLRSGGNRKRNFTDGWIEFVSKREAKIAVETLNTTIIGGKKGRYYHDDVWNLKYLKGFKWKHLTEQIANENAERAARMRAEDARERREVREYLRNVEKAKMIEGMEKKKGKKTATADEEIGEEKEDHMEEQAPAKPAKRQFRQIQVKSKAAKQGTESEPPDEVKRVLSKIF